MEASTSTVANTARSAASAEMAVSGGWGRRTHREVRSGQDVCKVSAFLRGLTWTRTTRELVSDARSRSNDEVTSPDHTETVDPRRPATSAGFRRRRVAAWCASRRKPSHRSSPWLCVLLPTCRCERGRSRSEHAPRQSTRSARIAVRTRLAKVVADPASTGVSAHRDGRLPLARARGGGGGLTCSGPHPGRSPRFSCRPSPPSRCRPRLPTRARSR